MQFEVVWYILEVAQDFVLDRDVDITVFNGDSAGTTAEQFDFDVVVAQQELDPFEGNDPSLVVAVGLFGYLVHELHQLLSRHRHTHLPHIAHGFLLEDLLFRFPIW